MNEFLTRFIYFSLLELAKVFFSFRVSLSCFEVTLQQSVTTFCSSPSFVERDGVDKNGIVRRV